MSLPQILNSPIDPSTKMLLPYVADALRLTDKEMINLDTRLWRFAAYIRQPRKDDLSCNKTPYFVRWDITPGVSYLTPDDPRYATQTECESIYRSLLAILLEAEGVQLLPSVVALAEATLNRPLQPASLLCVETNVLISSQDIKLALNYATAPLGGYEIPTSYRKQLNEDNSRHEASNVGWMKPVHLTYRLRAELKKLLQKAGLGQATVRNALEKIQVKAYCTDKATIPPYFSNRDIRWATWPQSKQYASHYQCALVELKLMADLFAFSNAPTLEPAIAANLNGIYEAPKEELKCFITGTVLDYNEYVQAALTPRGGRSGYHVAHIYPLTRGGQHAAANVTWASEDGNRIQGNLTLEQVEGTLISAVEYYLRRDTKAGRLTPMILQGIERLADAVAQARYVAAGINEAKDTPNQLPLGGQGVPSLVPLFAIQANAEPSLIWRGAAHRALALATQGLADDHLVYL